MRTFGFSLASGVDVDGNEVNGLLFNNHVDIVYTCILNQESQYRCLGLLDRLEVLISRGPEHFSYMHIITYVHITMHTNTDK